MARRRSRGRRSGGGRRRGLWWLPVLVLVVAAAIVAVRLGHRWTGSAEVFFVHYEAGHSGTLVPVRHAVPPGGAEERLSAALRDLLAGPSADEHSRGLVSEIPSGTALRSVQIRQGIVTVDLTSAFGSGGGGTSMLARVWQVVYTASQLQEATQVLILLDGHRVQALGGEGVVIGAPLRRPAAFPTF